MISLQHKLIQNRALSAILGCDYRIASENIRQNLKIKKISDRHKKLQKNGMTKL